MIKDILENVTFMASGRGPGKEGLWVQRNTENVCVRSYVCGCAHMGSAGEERKEIGGSHCRQEGKGSLRVYNVFEVYLVTTEYPGL